MIGKKCQLRTREFVVPSLSVQEVEDFESDGTLDRVPANGRTYLVNKESRGPMVRVLHAALRHNYPEITEAEVRAELDLENVERAVSALMGASGLLGGGKGSGEA